MVRDTAKPRSKEKTMVEEARGKKASIFPLTTAQHLLLYPQTDHPKCSRQRDVARAICDTVEAVVSDHLGKSKFKWS